jgi:2-polyprenyl-3-methyl-5-hydroxy-6-metoxy-1,4-benzoquinol methylase
VSSAAEEFSVNDPADLVVMINVLEHCRDATAVVSSLLATVSPGGVIVFGDVLFTDDNVRDASTSRYDAAHPLRKTGEVLAPIFEGAHLLFDSTTPAFIDGYPDAVLKYCVVRLD